MAKVEGDHAMRPILAPLCDGIDGQGGSVFGRGIQRDRLFLGDGREGRPDLLPVHGSPVQRGLGHGGSRPVGLVVVGHIDVDEG